MGKSISKNVCGTCSERLQTLNLEEKEQKLQENEFTLNGQTFRELSILEILKGKDYSTRATTDYTSERSLNSMEKPKIQKPKFKAAKPLWLEKVLDNTAKNQRSSCINDPLPNLPKSKNKPLPQSPQNLKISIRSRSPQSSKALKTPKITNNRHQKRSLSSNFSESSLNIIKQLKIQNSILIGDITLIDKEISRELENRSILINNTTLDLSPISFSSNES